MNSTLAVMSAETSLACLVLAGIVAVAAGRLLFRWFQTPVHPDPWETEAETLGDPATAQPLCLHCLQPHPGQAWFCPHCAAPVGEYNNYNPYLYIFSVGELLRTGTSGRYRRNWFTVAGFAVLGVTEFVILAPLYWRMVALNLRRQTASTPPATPAEPRA